MHSQWANLHHDPREIMDEIAALDRESAEILAGIGGML
jgi:type I restriction enzyme M protein